MIAQEYPKLEEKYQPYLPAAKEWLNQARSKEPWTQFTRGIVDSHAFGKSATKTAQVHVSGAFPDPEATAEICCGVEKPAEGEMCYLDAKSCFDAITPRGEDEGAALRGREKVCDAFCEAAQRWPEIRKAMSLCESYEQCQDVLRSLYGVAAKTADMIALHSGCEVPVVDKWVWERYHPEWDSHELKRQRNNDRMRKANPEFFQIRGRMIEDAEEVGMPISLYHVTTWLHDAFKPGPLPGESEAHPALLPEEAIPTTGPARATAHVKSFFED